MFFHSPAVFSAGSAQPGRHRALGFLNPILTIFSAQAPQAHNTQNLPGELAMNSKPKRTKTEILKKIKKLDLTVGFVFFVFLVFFSILYFNISFFLLLIFLYFDQVYSLKDNHDINILSIKSYIKNMYCQ